MKEVFLMPADARGREKMEEEISGAEGFGGCIEVGKSIMSTPIKAFPVGRGRRVILLVGAHHGAEHITANLLYATAYTLLTERGSVFQRKSVCKI